ncbi:MAG: hypothetical protein IT324_23475 [Anaerolineae bacterium]|nr:hypothetical protein [Anaerolineae bacterium]
MKRLSLLTLIFAAVSAVFLLLLIVLRSPFPLYPLVSYQDALDILTPFVLIPIYWLLFKAAAQDSSSPAEEIVFLLLAVIWVLGHGMHLATNAIDNLIGTLARRQVVDVTGTDIYHLTYFFDEHLSHYLWDTGTVGLAALLIYREWRRPAGIQTIWWAALLAGLIYGFTYFCIFLEGQSTALGLPFALLVTLLTLWRGRQRLGQQPILAFFFIACLTAVVLFLGWGLYWRGFPQFSDVGLI